MSSSVAASTLGCRLTAAICRAIHRISTFLHDVVSLFPHSSRIISPCMPSRTVALSFLLQRCPSTCIPLLEDSRVSSCSSRVLLAAPNACCE